MTPQPASLGAPAGQGLVRFGSFVLDLSTGELSRQGLRVSLQDQPARVLCLLVSRAGQLVTRDEVRRALWNEDTFVEFEAAIAVAINKIRQALGDSATKPRFIETIPRHGYRFLADVHPVTAARPVAREASVGRPIGLALLGVVIAAAAFSYWARTGPLDSRIQRQPASLTVAPFRIHEPGLSQNLGTEVAEAITKRLRGLDGAQVKPWSGVSIPGDSDASTLGRQLGVEAVLEGELRVSGEHLRVSTRLTSTVDGSRLWQDTFEMAASELSSVENRVAERLAHGLNLLVTDQQRARLMRRSTQNMDAYRWFLQGRWFFERRTEAGLREAIAAFRQATALDPDYALAYAWLANSYGALTYYGSAAPWEGRSLLIAAAEKALQLDDGLAEAHLASAAAVAFFSWQWAEAEAMYRQALALDPNYAAGHHWYALYLERLGRMGDALAERRRAVEIEPHTLTLGVGLADHFLQSRQPERAIHEAHELLDRNPTFWFALWIRGQAYEQLGQYKMAIEDLEAAQNASPNFMPISTSLVSALAGGGRVGEARRRVRALLNASHKQYVSPYELGIMHAVLKEPDQAFLWLEKACDVKDPRLSSIVSSWRVDTIRQDPRFQTLLTCVGLTPAANGMRELTR